MKVLRKCYHLYKNYKDNKITKKRYNKFFKNKVLKLHLGCGTLYKKGWINIDNNSDHNIKKLDVNWNLAKGIPFNDNSIDFIYHEHFIEHLTYEEGLKFMKECFRVLKKNGIMRLACPDLDMLIDSYIKNNWRKQDWVQTYNLDWLPSKCYMMNICMNIQPWGHQYVYNKEDMQSRLK